MIMLARSLTVKAARPASLHAKMATTAELRLPKRILFESFGERGRQKEEDEKKLE